MVMAKCKTLILSLVMALMIGSAGCSKKVEIISIDKEMVTVERGKFFTLTITILPINASDQSIAWSVDTQCVSALTSENTLQKEFIADSIGKANITVISSNGLKATCAVAVTENADDTAAREKAEEEARIAKEKADEEARIAMEKEKKQARIDELLEKIDQWEIDGCDIGAAYAQGYTQEEIDEAIAQRPDKTVIITKKRAYELAWEYSNKKYNLMLESEDEVKYIFREFEDMEDHIATVNWITVYKYTGYVDAWF